MACIVFYVALEHKYPSSQDHYVSCSQYVDNQSKFDGCVNRQTQKSIASSTEGLLAYTVYGFWFGIALLLINIIAIVLLKKTFVATDIAASAAESAQRAYVFLEFDTEFCGVPPHDATEKEKKVWVKSAFSVTPKFVNYGKTPATDFKAVVAFSIVIDDRIVHRMREYVDPSYPNPFKDELSDLFAPERSTEHDITHTSGSKTISSGSELTLEKFAPVGTLYNDRRYPDERGDCKVTEVFYYAEWSYTHVFRGKRSKKLARTSMKARLSTSDYADSSVSWALPYVKGIEISDTDLASSFKLSESA